MRAAPVPSRITTRPRHAAIQPSTVMPTRRMVDRRMGTPSARHAAWLGTYQDWQWDAKRYARTIGVVRFAANLVAATAGRVNLIVEQRNADGDWVETDDKNLRALLAQYGNETFGQTANELVRLHTWHYQVAGEGAICNRDDSQGVAEWLIASMDAIEWDKPRKELATVKFHPSGVINDGTAVVLDRDQMLRYWMPDEEWLGLATSPMTSVMDDIRRYRSLVRYAQRQAESYLAMNNILWSPEKPHTRPSSGDLTEHEGTDPVAANESTPFDLYQEWAQLSVNDDDTLNAVVPPWLWFGTKDDKPEVIDIASGLDEHGPEHREEALRDFARGSDSPMALIVGGGTSDENHWGAWITQERFVAAVAPTLDRVTHQDMTVAFLYPLMRLMGRTDMRQTRIGYDPAPVIVHPDMSDKALRGWLAGLVSSEAALREMGFDPNDAITPADMERLAKILSNFAGAGGGGGAGGAPSGGRIPNIKAPGEKVGPGTVQETGPKQPQPSGTGSPLGLAASVLGDYLPGTVNVGSIHVHDGNGHDNGHESGQVRTAAAMNGGSTGVMLALPVPPDVPAMYGQPDGEAPDDYHMTLLYFGDAADCDPALYAALKGICSAVASNSDMPSVTLSHVERFTAPTEGDTAGMEPCALVDDGPDVPELRRRLKDACDASGAMYRNDHAFRSHVTMGYYPTGDGPDQGPLPAPVDYSPDSLMLHWGDEVHAFPFVDAPEPGALPLDGAPVLASSRLVAASRRAYVEWNPEDHPRGEHGRFTTTGGDQPAPMPSITDLVDPQFIAAHGTDADRRYAMGMVRQYVGDTPTSMQLANGHFGTIVSFDPVAGQTPSADVSIRTPDGILTGRLEIPADEFGPNGRLTITDIANRVGEAVDDGRISQPSTETPTTPQTGRLDTTQQDEFERSFRDGVLGEAFATRMEDAGYPSYNNEPGQVFESPDSLVWQTQAPSGETITVPITSDLFDSGGSLNVDAFADAAISEYERAAAGVGRDVYGTEYNFDPTAYDNAMHEAEQILQSALPETFSGDLRWSGNSADFRISDPDGNTGKINFEISGDTLHVGLMQFDEGMQDRGLGTAMVGAVLSAAEQMNLSGIEFNANISVGGYAWARMGAYPTGSSWDSLAGVVSTRLAQADNVGVTVTEEQRQEITALLLGPPQNITKIAELSDKIDMTPIAQRYDPNGPATAAFGSGYAFNLDENNQIELGKALLLGTSWDARIPIGDQSAREEFTQYTAEKEAEKQTVAAAVGDKPGVGAYVRRDGTLDDATFWAEVLGDETLARTAAASRFSRRAYMFDPAAHPRDQGGRFTFSEGEGPELDPHHGDRFSMNVPTMDAFDPAMQAKIMAKVTAKITDTPEQIPARYRDLLEQSKTNGNYEAGLAWYQNTHDDAQALADASGVPMENVVGMLAAISPGTDWDTELPIGTAMVNLDKQTLDLEPETLANLQTKLDALAPGTTVENGMRFADLEPRPAVMAMQAQYMQGREPGPGGWGVGYSWDNYAKGLDILRNDQVDDRLNGVKVRSFYNNIYDPTDPDSVTIDLKMVQAAAGTREQTNDSSVMDAPSKFGVAVGPYPYLADALRQVADEDGITLNQAQAAIWMQWLYPDGPK